MGIQDRDYYWEDRKRREQKFNKEDTHNRLKEFRGTSGRKPKKPPKDSGGRWSWMKARKIDGYSFLSGFIFSFLLISFLISLIPGFFEFVSKPAVGLLKMFGVDVL